MVQPAHGQELVSKTELAEVHNSFIETGDIKDANSSMFLPSDPGARSPTIQVTEKR